MKENARTTALTILNNLDQNKTTLDLVVDEVLGTKTFLDRRETALTTALVYGTIRWKGRLDWIIDNFSRTRLSKIDPPILNILRLGLFQILYMDRIPESAAVNTSVELAKSTVSPFLAKFVNGVLRNALRGYDDLSFPDPEKERAKALSVGKSFPLWLVKRWTGRYGEQKTAALCDKINEIPPITIRANTLKVSRDELLEHIRGSVRELSPTRLSRSGISLTHPDSKISELTTFKEGWFQVQDEAAQLVAELVNPKPGERVLDACAGLGGKTGHLAQLMENRGILVAMDRDDRKLSKLDAEMKRLGIEMVRTLAFDLGRPLDESEQEPFDKILVDAPCSGLGVLRRNPDSKWSASKKNLGRYRKRQITFLTNVAAMVKPGGSLVYAVCSAEPEENEEVIRAFLASRPDFTVDKAPAGIEGEAASLVNQEGYIKTLPLDHDMDGFFSVCLKRKGS